MSDKKPYNKKDTKPDKKPNIAQLNKTSEKKDIKPKISELNKPSTAHGIKRTASQMITDVKPIIPQLKKTATQNIQPIIPKLETKPIIPANDIQQTDNPSESKFKVRVEDQLGGVVEFRVTNSTIMKKLMAEYTAHKQMQYGQLKFRFRAKPLNELETAEKLDMEEGDIIEVFEYNFGGGMSAPDAG